MKRFRESDEAILEPVFLQESYDHLHHEYMSNNYHVGRDDAAQLSALTILVEIGYVVSPATRKDWASLLERSIPIQLATVRAKSEWELDVLSRYRSMENLTKDAARQQFLEFLRTLPYGNSVFFDVRNIDDPIGLLPEKIILGINKRGLHFFHPVPKEYLRSVEFKDMMQFGRDNTAVAFKIIVAGVWHIFRFETKQVKEICVALYTHITNIMLHRYSKARAVASPKHANEKRALELSKSLEESENKFNQVLRKTRDDLKARTAELHDIEESNRKLASEKTSLEERISILQMQIALVEGNFEQERKSLKHRVSELDRKYEQTAAILEMQGAQLAEMEALNKEEQKASFLEVWIEDLCSSLGDTSNSLDEAKHVSVDQKRDVIFRTIQSLIEVYESSNHHLIAQRFDKLASSLL